ncbi:hypothetical protein FKM82_023950 [Ascaphus truei]|uniref:thrombospondin type-1 domain-containing protein 8 n=1 Tax=Ascaphus truei TaxID=8439 RepID=UPI003F59B4FF
MSHGSCASPGLAPLFLVLCCLSQNADAVVANNLLLGDRYQMSARHRQAKEDLNRQLNQEVEKLKFTTWGSWRCFCQRRIQARTREVTSLQGMAFFSDKDIRQEKPCSRFDCPQCVPGECV